jgi:anti-anti-sigma factor
VAGELDIATAPELDRTLREEIARGPVVLDLARLTFMDSTGIRVLSGALDAAATESWGLTVRPALHEHVRQVLEMTGMLAVLPFEPQVEEGRS